jgi:hypothetical protein
MKRVLYLILTHLLFYCSNSNAQSYRQLDIEIIPVAGSNQLNSEKCFATANDSFCIKVLKFYISGIQFFNDGMPVWSEVQSFHLIDMERPQSLTLKINIPDHLVADELLFNLGIDSITSVSGAFGDDLDPTKGMYWTWQSGYINLKVEGTIKSKVDGIKSFVYHLGGYQQNENAIQTLKFKIDQVNSLKLYFDVQKLITSEIVNQQAHIMSPGKEAVALSLRAKSCFHLVK